MMALCTCQMTWAYRDGLLESDHPACVRRACLEEDWQGSHLGQFLTALKGRLDEPIEAPLAADQERVSWADSIDA